MMGKPSRNKTSKRAKSSQKTSGDAPATPDGAAANDAPSSSSEQGGRSSGKSKMVSFILLLIIVIAMAGLAYLVMRSFILPLFLAALLVVIFEPVDRWIRLRVRGRRVVSALITTIVILLVVLVPIIWVIAVGVSEAAQLAHIDRAQIAVMTRKLDDFRKRFGLQIPFADQLSALEKAINDAVPSEEGDSNVSVSPRLLKKVQSELAAMERTLDDYLKDPDSDPALRARVEAASNNGLQLIKSSCEALEPVDAGTEPAVGNISAGLRAERLGDAYRTFRVELLGGFPLAPLIELANPSPHDVEVWQSKFASIARSWLLYLGGEAGGFIASFAVGLAVMVLAIFYFILDGPDMIRAAMQLSPLEDAYEAELLNEFSSVSRAVVLATLLSAIAQGLLGGIGYLICGVHPLALLTILTTLLAMVPFVGAAAIWVPTTLYLAFIADDKWGYAVFLGIWGFTVVSMADNLIKPLVLHGQSKLHPLLALLSVIGGVQALGPVGLLVGPMVVAFLQALLTMLQKEIHSLDTH